VRLVALEETLRELAAVFRQGGAEPQARTIDRLLAENASDLPRRVLDLYTQGMGGMYDPHLYRGGQPDPDANARRDALAERAHREARELLPRE
jgi:hypothetical protein